MLSDQDIRDLLDSIPSGVTPVVVSKTRTDEEIRRIYNLGHRIFGENRVQELVEKRDRLPEDIEWHMVGHLQSNKVKYIAPFISMIHSIDSPKLLRIVDKEAGKYGRVIPCLLQVHIASEETKFGFDSNGIRELMRSDAAHRMEHVRISGLMGMASFTEDEVKVRNEFRNLKMLYEDLKDSEAQAARGFSVLSMGMSGDYRIAMEEGSSMIRIGTLVFGPRPGSA